MTVKYDAGLEEHIPDLEVVRLRGEVAALKSRIAEMQSILEENDLADAKPKPISDGEAICHGQIAKFKELNDKNIPFQLEDVKTFEILVKCLLAIQGKQPIQDGKAKKKEKPVEIGELLRIVAEEKK